MKNALLGIGGIALAQIGDTLNSVSTPSEETSKTVIQAVIALVTAFFQWKHYKRQKNANTSK